MDAKIKKRLLKDSIGVLFWKFAGAIGLLAFYSVSAHAMSTTEFGQLSYLMALGMVASVLANGGLQRDAVRIGEAAFRNGGGSIFIKDMLNASIYILLMFALLSIVLWTFTSTGVMKSLEWSAFLIALAFIGARAYVIFFGEIIRGLHDGKTGTAIQQSIPYLIASVLILFLIQLSVVQNASTVLLSLTGGTLVALIVGLWTLSKATGRMQGDAKPEVEFKLKLLAPFVLTDFLLAMQQQGHVMILAGVADSDEVALFSAAFRAATLVALPLSVVNASIPSTIAELYSKNEKEKLSNILGSTSSISSVLALLLCTPLLIFSEELLTLMFGHNYTNASTAFRIMIVAQLINVWTGSPGRLIVIAKAGRAFFSITSLSVVGGLTATLILGNIFGAIGAAIGAFISLASHNILMAVYCEKTLGVKSYTTSKHIKYLAWKARYALEGRASNSRVFNLIETFTRSIENLIWKVKGAQVIECIGDSHSRAFRHINRTQNDFRYRAIVIKGATARGLGSNRSKTNSRRIALSAVSNFKPQSKVALLFGEVDCASTLWMLAHNRSINIETLLHETITKYFEFANQISNKGHAVYIISVPLPYLDDSEQSNHLINERRRLSIPMNEIMQLTKSFNQQLETICIGSNIKFVNLENELIDTQTNSIKSDLRSNIAGDHHYNRQSYAVILHKSIIKYWA